MRYLHGERGELRLTPDRRGLHGRLVLEAHAQRAAEQAARDVVNTKLGSLELRVIRVEDELRLLADRVDELDTHDEDVPVVEDSPASGDVEEHRVNDAVRPPTAPSADDDEENGQ
jgi:hypothetical protein